MLGIGSQKLLLPKETGSHITHVFYNNLSQRSNCRLTGPITLQLCRKYSPGNWCNACLNDALNSCFVCFQTDPTRCICYSIDLISFTRSMDGGERQAYFRPKSRQHNFFP